MQLQVLNDQYMEKYEKAWEEMMAGQLADVKLGTETKGGKAFLLGAPPKPGLKPETPGSSETKKDAKTALSEARTRNIINSAKSTGQAGFVRHPPVVSGAA